MFSELADDHRAMTNTTGGLFFCPLSSPATGQQRRSYRGCGVLLKDTSAAGGRQRHLMPAPAGRLSALKERSDPGRWYWRRFICCCATWPPDSESSTGSRRQKQTVNPTRVEFKFKLGTSPDSDEDNRLGASRPRGNGNYSE